jgi:ATP synthase protein I
MADEPRESKLRDSVRREAERLRRAEDDAGGLLAQTAYVGTLALLFVLPVLGGGYLGRWIDDQLAGYSVRWTITLLLAGVGVGMANVYLFVRARQ